MHNESECSEIDYVQTSIIKTLTDMLDNVKKSKMDIDFSGLWSDDFWNSKLLFQSNRNSILLYSS